MTDQIYQIVLGAVVYVEETSTPNPDDEWDRASTATSWSFHDIVEVMKEEDYKPSDYYYHSEQYLTYKIGFEPPEKLWLVIPVWSTGDSFGHDDCARAEIFGAYATKEEAKQRQDDLNKGNAGFGEYIPWDGYFESLDYVSVVEVDVVKV